MLVLWYLSLPAFVSIFLVWKSQPRAVKSRNNSKKPKLWDSSPTLVCFSVWSPSFIKGVLTAITCLLLRYVCRQWLQKVLQGHQATEVKTVQDSASAQPLTNRENFWSIYHFPKKDWLSFPPPGRETTQFLWSGTRSGCSTYGFFLDYQSWKGLNVMWFESLIL